jgi:hypothetical protein
MKKVNILDKEYDKVLFLIKNNLGESADDRFDIYLVVIDELKKHKMLSEFKYRLTDGEEINQLILDIINKNKSNDVLWFLKDKIEIFLEEDFIKKFIQ